MYSSGNRQAICTVIDIKHLPCKKPGTDLVVNKGQSDAQIQVPANTNQGSH